MYAIACDNASSQGSTRFERYNCTAQRNATVNIGAVFDGTTRVGKEQEIAMNIAVQDMYRDSCTRLTLHLRDSSESSAPSASTALELVSHENIQGLVGSLSVPEVAVLSETTNYLLDLPVIFLPPAALPLSFLPKMPSNLILMENSFNLHMDCLAAIVGYFQWQRVTVIYEQSSGFSLDSAIISVLSDSLRSVDATIQSQLAFPPILALPDPGLYIEKELHKLRNKSNRVFIFLHSSLRLATCLFQKAHQMGMMGEGFVWIVSEEIANFLNSVDSAVITSMQGVIGYRSRIIDTSKTYKEFKVKFEQLYLEKYPEDPGYPNPSLFALRAYDAIRLIDQASNGTAGKFSSKTLLSGKFEGLSGNVSFRHGELQGSPTFQIINVVGNGYRELAYWSPEFGFLKEFPTQRDTIDRENVTNNLVAELAPIYWPGGRVATPRGWTLGVSYDKPLRIGVPASGVFHQFVNVSIDKVQNKTYVTGFAVDVLNASLKYLPYDLPFVLVPFYGTYEDLVHGIDLKAFDAAVGDINILEERCRWADFTQPYVKSGMDMIVTARQDKTKEMWIFMMVLERKMWVLIPSLGIFIGFVVWLIERDSNPEFGEGSVSQQIGNVLWFSFTVLFFAQKESPRSNWSKIILAPWYFLVLMLTIYFTAALTSLMTISQLLPSINNVEILRRDNAVVGCNWNSFVCTYLADVLGFKPENIKRMRSMDEYPLAFQRGEIKAAFLVTSHAKVFLAKYCSGYTSAKPTYNFGGLGFAFSKGSEVFLDMSQAILKATETGEIESLERDMLSRCNCSTSTINNNSTTVGFEPLSGLFFFSGTTALVVLLVKVIDLVKRRWNLSSVMQELIGRGLNACASGASFVLSKIRSESATLTLPVRQISNSSSSVTCIEMP